jgi:hypothetical protein
MSSSPLPAAAAAAAAAVDAGQTWDANDQIGGQREATIINMVGGTVPESGAVAVEPDITIMPDPIVSVIDSRLP